MGLIAVMDKAVGDLGRVVIRCEEDGKVTFVRASDIGNIEIKTNIYRTCVNIRINYFLYKSIPILDNHEEEALKIAEDEVRRLLEDLGFSEYQPSERLDNGQSAGEQLDNGQLDNGQLDKEEE